MKEFILLKSKVLGILKFYYQKNFKQDQDSNIKQEYLEHDKLEKDLNKIIKNSKKRIDQRKADFDSLWKKTIELDSVPDDFLD